MSTTSTHTSSSPSASAFRPVALLLVGLALFGWGVYHGVDSYPGPDVFARFEGALPTLGAVASFALGVASVLAGSALIVPAAARLRRRGRKPVTAVTIRGPFSEQPLSAPRQAPARRDEYEEQDYGEEYHDQHGGTASGYPASGYPASGYGGAYGPYGGGRSGGYGGRGRENGEYDERRRSGSHPGSYR